MKKKILVNIALLTLLVTSFNHQDKINNFSETTTLNQETGKSIRFLQSNKIVEHSKIYVQTGSDAENVKYLRFATAITKGNISSLSYTRTIEGLDTKEVKVLTAYKSISSDGNYAYSNGDDVFMFELETSKDYYWATYTLKYESGNYYDANIDVVFSINGKQVASRSTTLNNELNPNNNLSLGEYLEYCSINNVAVTKKSFSEFRGWHNKKVNDILFSVVQGGCTDGNNLYFVYSNGECSKGVVCKITADKVITYSSTTFDLGTISGKETGNIAYVEGKLYVINHQGKILVFDAETLEQINEEVKFDLPSSETGTIYALYYNQTDQKYVLGLTNGHIYLFNKDLSIVSNEPFITTSSSGYGFRGLTGNDKYIYAFHNKSSVNQVELELFTYEGYSKDKRMLSNICLPEGETNTNYRIQSIVDLNGALYVGRNSWGWGDASYILKNTFDSTNLIDQKGIYQTHKMNLGEYVQTQNYLSRNTEYSFNNEKTVKLASNKFEGDTTTYGGIQDTCTDGSNLYLAISASSNYKTRIIKYNYLTKEVSYSNPIINGENSNWNYDSANITCAENKLYLTKSDGKLIVLNAETLQEETTKEINGKKIKSLIYNKDREMFAITLDSGKTEFYDKEFSLLDKPSFTISTSLLQTINGNDKYIYCVYGDDNSDSVDVKIYSYDGVNLSNTTIMNISQGSLTGGRNVQNIFEVNNLLYASVFDYDNSRTFIYSISLKKGVTNA